MAQVNSCDLLFLFLWGWLVVLAIINGVKAAEEIKVIDIVI